jgi:hypothetical protein
LVWLPRILPPRLLICDCKKSAPNSAGRHCTVSRNGLLRAAQQTSYIRHELDAGNRPHDVSPLSNCRTRKTRTPQVATRRRTVAVTIRRVPLLQRLVGLEPDERFQFWSQWLEQQAPRLCPHQREQMTEFAWKLVQVLPYLDRKPFGLELSTRLAASLQRHADGMFYWHPYHCGHGLRLKAGNYLLEVKDDIEEAPLATWSDEPSFIDAVASWSDYVCSGADPDATLFQTTSAFYLDNQRITRQRIEEFIERSPAA